jgi:hypothetical protein
MSKDGAVAIGGLIAIATWIFVVLPFLYGQPSPRLTEATNPEDTHARQSDQASPSQRNGSASAPFFVEVIPSPKSAQERAQEAQDREDHKSAEIWLVIWTAALSIATVFLMAATGVLGYFAFRQMRDMKDSINVAKRTADIARDALISTERAFVFLEDFNPDYRVALRGSSGGGKEITSLLVKPRWRNSGTTPTRKMSILVNWTHWSGETLTGIGEYGEIQPTKMFLGPNATEWSEAISIPGNVATAALKGTETINIWGRVDYEDIFGDTDPHFTEWCYRLQFTDAGHEISIQFVAFSDYNRSDEDSRAKGRA